MHPALIIALVAEHERELARRTRHPRRHPAARTAPATSPPPRRAQRGPSVIARGLARFS